MGEGINSSWHSLNLGSTCWLQWKKLINICVLTMPNTILSVWHEFTPLILTLYCRYDAYTHLADEETETRASWVICQNHMVTSGGAIIHGSRGHTLNDHTVWLFLQLTQRSSSLALSKNLSVVPTSCDSALYWPNKSFPLLLSEEHQPGHSSFRHFLTVIIYKFFTVPFTRNLALF